MASDVLYTSATNAAHIHHVTDLIKMAALKVTFSLLSNVDFQVMNRLKIPDVSLFFSPFLSIGSARLLRFGTLYGPFLTCVYNFCFHIHGLVLYFLERKQMLSTTIISPTHIGFLLLMNVCLVLFLKPLILTIGNVNTTAIAVLY